MAFVNNSENLWDYLANERDWREMGLDQLDADDELLL
jgi:hypothetical protein